MGSKKRISLSSARCNRTSPIRGMRLRRLLVKSIGVRLHCRGGAPACLSACVLAVWRSAQGSLDIDIEDGLGRSPRMRPARCSRLGFLRLHTCTSTFYLPLYRRKTRRYFVARAWNINMCGCAAPNHTANTTTYTALLPRHPPRDCLYVSCPTSELTWPQTPLPHPSRATRPLP